MTRAALVILAALAVLATAQGALAGTTYYVSPSGSDGAAGDAAHPWQTVARVNRASLQAGDTVLFQGAATFADAALMPAQSGTAGSPITFGTYGSGRPNLSQGIWFSQKSYLTFDGIGVDAGTAPGDLSALQASASGSGSTNIVVRNCAFTHVRIAINSANTGDAYWTVTDTLIQHTRDSGAILLGHDLTFRNDTILDTGEDSSISYGKHGVYAKGPNQTFVGNTIRRFSANGLSLRFRNARAEGNTISDGAIGVAWFQIDPSAGTSVIAYNRISSTSSSGIYISPSDAAGSTRESFVISDNTVAGSGGNGADISATSGSLTLANNVFTGSISPVVRLFAPGGGLSEHHNAYWAANGSPQLVWGASWLALAAFKTATGQGGGDLAVDPKLGSDLTPAAASLVDGGSSSVSGVSYSAGCDGVTFHYCGSSPDIGAVESGAAAVPPPPVPVAPLAPPTALAAASTASSVTLTWTAAADPRVASYAAKRDGAPAGTTSGTSITVSGLACGTTSTYAVQSVGPDGATSTPATVTASTAACSTPPPPPPPAVVKDTTPPWVLITAPTKGQTVPLSTTETVDASDTQSGIADVTFWVDGTIICVDRTAPYSCALTLPRGKHTLLVRATDGAGNIGWMSVQVTSSGKGAAVAPATGTSVAPTFALSYRGVSASSVAFVLDGRTVCVDRAAPFRCAVSARSGWHRALVRVAGHGTLSTRFRVR